ncbi:hypothetical protein [Oligoflexus tunisiensis]|uniref:hypothetical protein n=1 Tax=Oligoflexus tunisiensis TaxID=708132 RepID=UPI00114CBE4B|nr:hypothetical protein [Oligoflexus tunisiensis]
MRLLFVPALLALACCSHAATNAAETRKGETETSDTKQHFKEGWENIKQGGREVAEGVATGAKKAGRAIQAVACPVAADQSRGVYYAKDSPGYETMLSAEKSDVRECFASEAGAREQGYTLVR